MHGFQSFQGHPVKSYHYLYIQTSFIKFCLAKSRRNRKAVVGFKRGCSTKFSPINSFEFIHFVYREGGKELLFFEKRENQTDRQTLIICHFKEAGNQKEIPSKRKVHRHLKMFSAKLRPI